MKLNSLQKKTISKETKKTIIYFSGIMCLTIIISFFILFFNQYSLLPNSSGITKSIIDGNISVNKNSYIFYDFNIQSNSFRIKGNFTIFEAEEEIISVYIMDEFNLFLWINNKNSHMSFNSGAVNNGEIDEHISAGGIFFLVFDNLSYETQKNLQVQVYSFYFPSQ